MQEDNSSEISYCIKEEDIIDLDNDIEEFQSPNSNDGIDLRFFKFKIFSQETNVDTNKKAESKASQVEVNADGQYCLQISRKKMEFKENSYARAVSMPVERGKNSLTGNFSKSNSFPVYSSPAHVHPKLPDYDKVVAKFTAFKKANSQKIKI